VIEYRGKRGTVWRIKYVDASGRQVMETVGAERDGMTEERARELLEDRRVDVRRDGYRQPEAKTFGQAAQEWHAAERTARAWKPVTATKYRQSAEHLAGYFRGPVSAIRPRHVAAWRDSALRELEPATVSRHMTVLNLICKWALREELLERNPVTGTGYPKVRQKKGVVLSPEQVRALLRSFEDEQAKTAFLTFLLTGIRISELQALRWHDLSLTERRLRVEDSKTETGERSIALPPGLIEALEAHYQRTAFRGDDERVFCHPELGSAYRFDRYKPELMRAFARAGLTWPEGFRAAHDLRVTAATNFVMAGMHPDKLRATLGHSDHRVTQRYVNLAGVVFADEAEALEQRLLGPSVEEASRNIA
jgi:integrase